MQNVYYQIYMLLDQLNQPNSRLNKIQKIIQQPNFQYKKEDGADLILSMFLKSSYWLDKELFDESYLYKKENKNLLPMQQIHLTMVDIGATLLTKGFPLEYRASEYITAGPKELAPYVETFVKQCHNRHTFLQQNTSQKNNKW